MSSLASCVPYCNASRQGFAAGVGASGAASVWGGLAAGGASAAASGVEGSAGGEAPPQAKRAKVIRSIG
ncbi:MAG: hypothetical protein IPI35_26970 [Deltaproteobacteria bacterium]|nr:hypothetical protein [Deltaproteobacteria bacterium]